MTGQNPFFGRDSADSCKSAAFTGGRSDSCRHINLSNPKKEVLLVGEQAETLLAALSEGLAVSSPTCKRLNAATIPVELPTAGWVSGARGAMSYCPSSNTSALPDQGETVLLHLCRVGVNSL